MPPCGGPPFFLRHNSRNVIRFLYTVLLFVAFPYIAWRIIKRGGGREKIPWREYFGYCPIPPKTPPVVWIHTVSVGEAQAAAQLARRLRDDGYQLLLTHTTAAGREWLKATHPQAVVAALPLDFPGAVRRFLRRSRPRLGVVLEAEYWLNLSTAMHDGGVPLLLANARLSAKSARRYRYAAAWMRDCVACFDAAAAQTARDAGRLRCYGARRIVTAGNLKFDLPLPPPASSRRVHAKPTVLFAATRDGEERLLLAALDDDFWRRCFVILAPRHPQRRDDIVALLKARGVEYAVRSGGGVVGDETQVYLADTMGEMARWYGACDAAVIGGGFLPHGGQNPIEAMRYGVAAVVGPHMDNYAALTRRAVAAGALSQADDAATAAVRLNELLTDGGQIRQMRETAQRFCQGEGGALEKNLALARELLSANGNG